MKASLSKILKGYENYQKGYLQENKSLFHSLAYKGQSPKTMLITCCDSRIDPSLLLESQPGDLFTHRNIANIVPRNRIDHEQHGTMTAIEYGVRILNVENVIVLGHSDCGGVRALLDQENIRNTDFIIDWAMNIREVYKALIGKYPDHPKEEFLTRLEKESIIVSLRNLKNYEFIKQKLDNGALNIYGWYFDISSGKIFYYDEKNVDFYPLEELK